MIEKQFYANGQKIQEYNGNSLTCYFKNGKIKAEGMYENELMEGEWRFYRETGQLWQVGHFLHGKKNGTWIKYDQSGQLEYIE